MSDLRTIRVVNFLPLFRPFCDIVKLSKSSARKSRRVILLTENG